MAKPTPLVVGEPAPDFTLAATGGRQVSLSDFRGQQHVVLAFYPKNNTSGWNRQLSAFRDDIDQFGELDAAVITVNPAPVAAHERWAAKMGFNFPLLSDPDRQVCAAYQVLKENGKSVQRTVYIVDKQGVIRYAKQGLPPDSELLEVLRELQE